MITIDTSRFGKVEVEEDRIIHFPEGLLGFPSLKGYVLIDYKDTPLKWLQSVDDPTIAFIVTEPSVLVPDYSVPLDEEAKKLIEIGDVQDLAVLIIIRVENEQVIANLRGPIVMNARVMKGIQIALDH